MPEDFSIERAVWAAMQDLRPRTLDDLQILTGQDAADILIYVNTLLRHQYMDAMDVRRAGSGEAIAVFVVSNRTGPLAPHRDENGRFVDPNLADADPDTNRRGAFIAAVRLAAERLAGPPGCEWFTPQQLRDAVRDWPESRTDRWRYARGQLKQSGEIQRIERAGQAYWIYRPNQEADRIRSFFKDHLGAEIRGRDLHARNGAVIRQALDILLAEGYTVEVVSANHKTGSVYRVTAPNETEASHE